MDVIESVAYKSLTTLTALLIKKFAGLGWSKVVEEFNASFNQKDLSEFCKACEEYLNIRTLYSSQKDIFIDDVYVPLFMSPSNDIHEKYEISNLSLYSEGITNIIGRAGQGKSTFLRKMLINEFQNGNSIPVFFELKYINPEEAFVPQLSRWFKKHNLKISEKGIERLLKHGYLKIFLDAFDEIEPSKHDEALSKIKDLSRAFPKVTVIVTSRPDTIITTEPFISNYKVLDLTKENVKQLFLNISENNVEKTNDAVEQLEKYPSIFEIARTPILAILLFITYRAWSKIPDNLSDFYKKIFITLLTHHDSLKPGKKIDRGINIPLNDHKIEDVFSVFCFTTFSKDSTSFSTRKASEFMSVALESEGHDDICADNVVNIIKKCTGIICNDGYDQLSFSHKSLQEYYAASYISSQRIYDIRNFYSSVKTLEQERKYEAVLKFLSSVDRENYTRYYYIPCFEEMFEVSVVKPGVDRETMMTGINKIIGAVKIPFIGHQKRLEKYKENKLHWSNVGLRFVVDADKSSFFYKKLMHPLLSCLTKSGVYFNYLESHKDEISERLKTSQEIDVALMDLLNNIEVKEAEKFMGLLTMAFEKHILEEHEHIITYYNKKNKPSLLNQVFKKEENEAIG